MADLRHHLIDLPAVLAANVGEIFPDPISPLNATVGFQEYLEPGWRDAFVASGVWEHDLYDTAVERNILPAFGRYLYINMSLMRLFGVRVPGMGAEAVDLQYFGDMPGSTSNCSTWSRLSSWSGTRRRCPGGRAATRGRPSAPRPARPSRGCPAAPASPAGGPGCCSTRTTPRPWSRGEVLVAPITDPSWTPLFVAASAVVVDVGAPFSHAAIVSRELGIPCVVSATEATRRIPDGALVEVDGNTGVVTVLEV